MTSNVTVNIDIAVRLPNIVERQREINAIARRERLEEEEEEERETQEQLRAQAKGIQEETQQYIPYERPAEEEIAAVLPEEPNSHIFGIVPFEVTTREAIYEGKELANTGTSQTVGFNSTGDPLEYDLDNNFFSSTEATFAWVFPLQEGYVRRNYSGKVNRRIQKEKISRKTGKPRFNRNFEIQTLATYNPPDNHTVTYSIDEGPRFGDKTEACIKAYNAGRGFKIHFGEHGSSGWLEANVPLDLHKRRQATSKTAPYPKDRGWTVEFDVKCVNTDFTDIFWNLYFGSTRNLSTNETYGYLTNDGELFYANAYFNRDTFTENWQYYDSIYEEEGSELMIPEHWHRVSVTYRADPDYYIIVHVNGKIVHYVIVDEKFMVPNYDLLNVFEVWVDSDAFFGKARITELPLYKDNNYKPQSLYVQPKGP